MTPPPQIPNPFAPSDASVVEIKRAYKKKALLNHPDKQALATPQAAKRAADKMQKINQAYASPSPAFLSSGRYNIARHACNNTETGYCRQTDTRR